MAAMSHDKKPSSGYWLNLVRMDESETNYILDELRGKSGVIAMK